MKHFFTFLVVLTFSTNLLVSQTIVGTDPENKNVVLEEFTGIYCVFCPQGHAIAQGIYDSHPDDVVLINIHTGGYAVPTGNDPDFRTPWGAAIAGQSGLVGYPAGTVNRHLFPGYSQGSGTAQSRGTWSTTSNTILNEASYLNIELEATIVTSTRQLVVYVEVYYTGDSPEESNWLNVALLQNHILGPQTGGNSGDNYDHKHMLRHLLTGQWGAEITETSEGSLYTGTFAYEIPADYNDVEVVLENLDVVAFVTETHQEVVSGNMAEITLAESFDYDAAIVSASVPQTACSGEFSPQVLLKNYGATNLSSLEFSYSANGEETATYSWTGDLDQNESEIVSLPTIYYSVTDDNEFNITCDLPNGEKDQLPQNNSFSAYSEGSVTFPENCMLGIDIYGDPTGVTWDLKNETGEIIDEGGPYTNTGFNLENISFPEAGCYTFTLNDASGNGLSGGSYLITDMNTNILFTGKPFEYTAIAELAYDITIDVNEIGISENISIYPNPVTQSATIELFLNRANDVKVAVFDMLGRNVKTLHDGAMASGKQNIKLDATSLKNGFYFVQVTVGSEVHTEKISIR